MWLSSSCKLDFITIKFAIIFNGQLLKTLSSFLSTRKYSVWKITFLFSIWSRRSVVQQKRCQRESVIPVCHRRFAVAPLMAWWCSVCETDLSVLVPQIRKKTFCLFCKDCFRVSGNVVDCSLHVGCCKPTRSKCSLCNACLFLAIIPCDLNQSAPLRRLHMSSLVLEHNG